MFLLNEPFSSGAHGVLAVLSGIQDTRQNNFINLSPSIRNHTSSRAICEKTPSKPSTI